MFTIGLVVRGTGKPAHCKKVCTGCLLGGFAKDRRTDKNSEAHFTEGNGGGDAHVCGVVAGTPRRANRNVIPIDYNKPEFARLRRYLSNTATDTRSPTPSSKTCSCNQRATNVRSVCSTELSATARRLVLLRQISPAIQRLNNMILKLQ
jgi:hypothetical protein